MTPREHIHACLEGVIQVLRDDSLHLGPTGTSVVTIHNAELGTVCWVVHLHNVGS